MIWVGWQSVWCGAFGYRCSLISWARQGVVSSMFSFHHGPAGHAGDMEMYSVIHTSSHTKKVVLVYEIYKNCNWRNGKLAQCMNHCGSYWGSLMIMILMWPWLWIIWSLLNRLNILIWNNNMSMMEDQIDMTDCFLGNAFGVLSCTFWSTVLQCGARQQIKTWNYWTV